MDHHLPVVDSLYNFSNISSSSISSLNININNEDETKLENVALNRPPAHVDPPSETPLLLHRWIHDYSVISMAVSQKYRLLFAGTQDSKILVFDLLNFQKLQEVDTDHTGSILSLIISSNDAYLFSTSSDSLIKIWDISSVIGHQLGTSSISQVVEISTVYSLVDVGDIFSIALSNRLNILFFGTQNASIQWVNLSDKHNFIKLTKNNINKLPFIRYDKFFDSKPGGRANEKDSSVQVNEKIEKYSSKLVLKSGKMALIEIPLDNVLSFAHNGFIYDMKIVDKSVFQGNPMVPDFAEYLVSAGGDGLIKIWGIFNEVKEHEQQLLFIKELDNQDPVLSIAISEFFLYCGLVDGQVKVWDLSTFQLIKLIKKDYSGEINSLVYHPSLNCLFKGTETGCCKYSLAKDDRVRLTDWYSNEGSVLSVKLLPKYNETSDLLITAGHSGIATWNLPRAHVAPQSVSFNNDKFSNSNLLKSLATLVGFKSISKKPERYIDESRGCANFLSHLFKSFGAETKLLPVEDGNPVVYGCFRQNSVQTPKRVLWYGHYDVVETENDQGWSTDPFTLVAEDAYLHARGVTDNKGPLLAAIYAVAEQFQQGLLDADVVFLIEGEEEAGSFGFKSLLVNHKDLVGPIDWILFSNSYWLDDRTPCLNYGLRGLVSCEVSVFSEKSDRHSGVDGGVSREPTIDLVNLLSKLSDNQTGKVLVPNFYDPILPISKSELKLYENIVDKLNPVDKADLNINNLLKKWRLPSLTVHKMQVSGPRNSTIIPKTASATISMRIVPNQTIKQVRHSLLQHLKKHFVELNTTNSLQIKFVREIEPWLGDVNNALYKRLASSVASEWSLEPLFIREGGSIPSIRFMERFFNAKAAQIPCGQSSDNAHLINERLRILNLFNLRRILMNVFHDIPEGEGEIEQMEEAKERNHVYLVEGKKVLDTDKTYSIEEEIHKLIIRD